MDAVTELRKEGKAMKFKGTKLSKRTVALLAAAVVMLGSSGVMGAKAAPNITAVDPYDATLQLNSLAVDITEKVAGGDETVVSDGELTLTEDEVFSIGKKYDDVISVKNSGDADEYVRVLVRKYWTDAEGKRLDLAPEYIDLKPASGWKEEKGTNGINEEYWIYYLSEPLAVRDSKELFTGFRIDERVKTEGKKIILTGKEYPEGKEFPSDEAAVEMASDGDTITYTYTYDGCIFNVEAEAQSVQTHNSADAIKSLWGVDASSVGIKLVD